MEVGKQGVWVRKESLRDNIIVGINLFKWVCGERAKVWYLLVYVRDADKIWEEEEEGGILEKETGFPKETGAAVV